MRKKRKGILYRLLRAIIKGLSAKPKIINKNEKLPEQAIYISNHSAANGPLRLNMFLPFDFTFWGIHDMLGNFKTRRRYLIDVFYGQKLHYGKFKSWLIGTLFAIISKYIYNNAGVIGTYQDAGFVSTIRQSIKVLENKGNILIFPEDSSDGYHDILKKYYKGFALLSYFYYQKSNIDLPVYPIYFSKKLKKIIIGTPFYVNKLLSEDKSFDDITTMALEITNSYAHEIGVQ